MDDLKIIFLGTNGWYTSDTGNTPSVLIDTEDQYIILDAGNGFHKLDEYVSDFNKPVFIFLSHFHIDHISGLHILAKYNFRGGLKICSFKGCGKLLNGFINQPYTMPLKDLPYKVDIIEMEQGEQDMFPFKVKCLEMVHSSKCFGYRIIVRDRVISYCTDTGYCDNALNLAAGADLLIAECALKSGESMADWPHLSPEMAAKLARQSAAKRLVLTHFDADNYRTIEDRIFAQQKARAVFKNTMASEDGLLIKL